MEDEIFDSFYNTKRDLGKVIKDLTKLVGIEKIVQWFSEPLMFVCQQREQNPENDCCLVKIHAVLAAFEAVTRIVEFEELEVIKDFIALIFKLPTDRFMGLYLIAIEIIEDLSFLL